MGKLLTMLMRFDMGEKKVWSVVHVPSREAEDRRHLHRQLRSLKAERTRYSNRRCLAQRFDRHQRGEDERQRGGG